MTLDIRGSLKNTKISHNSFVVFGELLSNAIDSYLIRQSSETNTEPLSVLFDVEFFDKDLEGHIYEVKISCTDNGAGFAEGQTKAFVTKDTSFKDDLNIQGIGECKGSGRIQFLHYFTKITIDSIYRDEGNYFRRKLKLLSGDKEINESSFITEQVSDAHLKTKVTLDIIKPEIYEKVFSGTNLRQKFSAEALKYHVIVNFLQRFVSLKETLGDFSIKFQTKYKDQENQSCISPVDLPDITQVKSTEVSYLDSNRQKTERAEKFTITHYKLEKSRYNLPKNIVAFCAKSTPVVDLTKRFLKTKTLENNDIDGFYHIILIESNYLDRYVNEQRDNFNIPNDPTNTDMFMKNLISMDEICVSIDEIVYEMLSPPDWDREKIVENIQTRYGISPSMLAESNTRIHYGDTEESVVKRVLSSYQDKIIKDTSEIFSIREQLASIEPDSEDFRQKVSELAWKYTSSLKSIDMANLSQLVVRRAAIIEILSMATKKELGIQKISGEAKRKDEKIIHNIFFPMGKDNHEVADHDIWLLSEEYHYYQYIASDKSLAAIKWEDGNNLFENDIDEEMKKIFEKNSIENARKRPDIAIFNKEGSAIIIEFKAPGVDMSDHTADLMEYSQLLSAKSEGRLKKFYGYLIGTDVNPNRIGAPYNRFHNGKGWFGTQALQEPTTRAHVGELYSEILFYQDIVHRAEKRLEVYKDRLQLNL